MADVPYSGVPQVSPLATPSDDYQRVQTNPNQFGGAIAAGEERAGQGLVQTGTNLFDIAQFHGQVNVDDQINHTISAWDKIQHGDPNKPAVGPDGNPVLGPDGKPQPDLGYNGLQGRALADQRDATLKAFEDVRQQGRDNLTSPAQQLQYDEQTRRLLSLRTQEIGERADAGWRNWAAKVNEEGAAHSKDGFLSDLNDPENMAHNAKDYINFKVQQAQTQFGDDPTIKAQTIADAKRDLVKAQIEQIQVNEPAKAKSIADSNRTILGPEYGPTTERLIARADQQTGTTEGRQAYFEAGQAKGQQMMGAQAPTDTARSLLRNFESFRPQAYWDVNHYRAGYGSDTVTNPDGTVVPVTKDTVVTQADAERDLQRRTAETTQQVQGQIGPAWNSMTPQAQASLVSVAYNYGQLPQSVVTAAQTGDANKLSQAVLDLGTDNGGVNADRRRLESEMISGLKGDAYRTILNNPKLNTNQQNYAFEEIRRLDTAAEYATNANATAVKQANDRAANGYVSQMLKGQMPSTDQIANDPNLTWETRRALGEAALKQSGSDDVQANEQTYGPGFWSAYKAVSAPAGDPNRIADLTQLLQRAGPGGDLTLAGVEKLGQVMQQNQKSVSDQSVNTTKIGLLNYAKSKLSFDQEMLFPGMKPLSDPAGAQAFNATFVPKFEAAYDQWVKAGKNPWEFLTKDNVDKLMQGIRSPSEMAAARIAATSEPTEIPEGPPPPPPEGINPAAWNGVLADRPKANGAPYPLDAWIKVVEMLRKDPSPRNIKLFDESQFGRAGFRGAEILGKLGGNQMAQAPERSAPPEATKEEPPKGGGRGLTKPPLEWGTTGGIGPAETPTPAPAQPEPPGVSYRPQRTRAGVVPEEPQW